ncbi:hypothetical protein CTI12_AA195300 [Artemisia annua]|uniref:RRM domain-containing protein n=1 Tax=Artemisia annua TaxID=35608 RepID=A0A2U1NUE0_ARTAN|nr:hypothetical protein CTI12_AA195300 [Artemisia annua]
MKGKATTFFFTRFLDSWNEKALWEMFARFGTVVDVYLASKRTKLGTRFGFVRFINVGNTSYFEQKLGEICIGNTKILVKIAKYEKGGQTMYNMDKEEKKQDEWRWTFKNEKKGNQNNEWRWTFGKVHGEKYEKGLNTSGISYKDVMVGNHTTMTHQKHMEDTEDIMEFQVNHDQMARLKKCWVGKAGNIHVLRNVWTLLKQDGLGGCIIHYLGGMSILCEWSSQAVAKECLEKNKVNLANWFTELVMWDENIEPHGRITWLEIEGIPALIWDSNTARKIGEKMGSVLEIDDIGVRHNISNSVLS